MKKTQKILSLVVVLAFALSMCSISAFAAKQLVSTSEPVNILDSSQWTDIAAVGQKYAYNNADGVQTGTSNSSQGSWKVAIQSGVVTINGTDDARSRWVIDANEGYTFPANSGVLTVSFDFKAPATESTKALTIYGFGVNGNPSAAASTTRSNGVDTIGGVTISPDTSYRFEAVMDTDNHTYTYKVGETVVKSGTITAISGSDTITRLVDTNYTYRTIEISNFTATKTVNTYVDDGKSVYMTGDFSGTGTLSANNFLDATGNKPFTMQVGTNCTYANGELTVGAAGANGRLLLHRGATITSGTYTVEFEFMKPVLASGGTGVTGTYIHGFGHSSDQINRIQTGSSTDGEYIGFNGNGAQPVVQLVAGEWYDFKATIDVSYDESNAVYVYDYVVTVDDILVNKETTTSANALYRLFDYGGNNASDASGNRIVKYRNYAMYQNTRDYAIEDVTVADGKVSARFLSNAVPNATFFVAIKENGVLTSLKAISSFDYFTMKEVGTYSCADDEVEVEWYAWASKGLMPVYTYTAQ